MCSPYTPSTAFTMTSLPKLPPAQTSQAAVQCNRREVSYHPDNQGRYAIQAYEVRPHSRRSPPTRTPCWHRLKSNDYYPMLHSVERTRPTDFRTSQNPIVVAQSCDGRQLNKIGPKGISEDLPMPTELPPPAPRPHRLSTPDLSDLKEERPFCYCDAEESCDSKRTCARRISRRALS
ncbi:uncharacterized protein M421DRAFT_133675 [Didymella exigua CBS 183.55]|uniref:Uncharacterized protein n=1 Tax=Didymella exigua CBS 183.55 TaxID=1150837 RepID=A0A6A5RQ57_9PLEO|nr:uncharacterized protein M421DRAFT_133675 [Didymella exigua CBS 183.55]KAF1929184.1 hypothetical protein M421DRAFT_133675 [Didymella exigua CBS 183.55]